MFCYNDIINQKLLEADLDNFLQHIRLNKEPHASLLLVELFRNNHSLLLNMDIFHKVNKFYVLIELDNKSACKTSKLALIFLSFKDLLIPKYAGVP